MIFILRLWGWSINFSHWVFVSKFSESSPTQISRIDWTLIISPPTTSLNLYRWHHPRVLNVFFLFYWFYRKPWSCCNGLPLFFVVKTLGQETVWGCSEFPWLKPGVCFTRGPGTYKSGKRPVGVREGSGRWIEGPKNSGFPRFVV